MIIKVLLNSYNAIQYNTIQSMFISLQQGTIHEASMLLDAWGFVEIVPYLNFPWLKPTTW